MAKTFPKFASHSQASCFNCSGDFADDGAESGHASGRGAFVQRCEKCRMSTWYDIKAKKAA